MSRRIAVSMLAATVLVTVLLAAMAPAEADTGSSIAPPTTLVENVFLPDDANIGDCVSSLPRPECGSEARGGWRQTLLLGVLALGLGGIGWRIVRGMRGERHGEEGT